MAHESDESDQLPELTPEQETTVRRLLAQARHDEPVPAEVGQRLDRVLAGLAREEPASEGTGPVAPVIDLAAKRRRRNAAALLAAAAAVIVAGFAIGQMPDVADNSANDSAGGSVASSRDNPDGSAGGQEAAPEDQPKSETFSLSSNNLKHDVQSQLRGAEPSPTAVYGAEADVLCPATPSDAYGSGEIFPALFDGVRTVLALRPPEGGQRLAEVLACGSGARLASVRIPAH